MSVTFSGVDKLIICDPGTTEIDVAGVYSRWKDWAAESVNLKWLQAFSVVGGDPVTGTILITPYFFLLNGWRVRPQEADHELEVTGILTVAGGGNPFIPTLGTYNVQIRSYLPVKTETFGVDPDVTADAVWANTGAATMTQQIRKAQQLAAAGLAR